MIRAATPQDAPAIAELLGQLGYPTPVPDIPPRLMRLAAREGVAYLAADGEAVNGLIAGERLVPLTGQDPEVMLMALVVRNGVRGSGVGRALVEALASWGRTFGADRIMVTTHVRRADAHAFYERLGFEFTGRRYVRRPL